MPSVDAPCEQVPSGFVVFDQLEEGSEAGSKTESRYELRLRSTGVVERGKFRVDCVVPAVISPTLNPLELANAELLTSQPLGNWLLAK